MSIETRCLSSALSSACYVLRNHILCLRSGNLELDGCYRPIDPLEQKNAF